MGQGSGTLASSTLPCSPMGPAPALHLCFHCMMRCQGTESCRDITTGCSHHRGLGASPLHSVVLALWVLALLRVSCHFA